MIALLGRRDFPTDALEDYCDFLGQAFEKRGQELKLVRVPWRELGWTRAILTHWRESSQWHGQWVLVQYTALSWSRRGFPFPFLLVLCMIRIRQERAVVVFHDQLPSGGKNLVDRVRWISKHMVMRWAYMLSDASILTVPLDHDSWLPRPGTKAAYIPIGPNIPVSAMPGRTARNGCESRTITVFGITDAGDITKEVADIALAVTRGAKHVPHVRLVSVGRGSTESESKLRDALKGSSVEFNALGILPADKVSQVLANSDVSLYVRSPISTQRGSAIASIANGVPLVAYANPNLPAPLADAGVVVVPYGDSDKLAEATVRVLTNPQLWQDLHERSQRAYEKYFSWEVVAKRFLEVLHNA
jgi:glycosyltransferase involved in cell wall biosynthesis